MRRRVPLLRVRFGGFRPEPPVWVSAAARPVRREAHNTMPGRPVGRPGIVPLPGHAVVRSQTPKFWPLFHSTGELITTAPAEVPVVVSMTWWVVHGPRSVP